MRRVVVVGAGLAGLRAAEAVRRAGFDGSLALVGAEPHLPYDRPPLSKEMLAGEWEHDEIVLRKQPYDELDLELRLGAAAVALDRAGSVVRLDDGTALAFDGLVLACGATPRTLPNPDGLDGIFTLRTIDDCHAIRAELDRNPKVVVVGAGFIGAEVAATCRRRGLDVTVLEALPAPMVRGLGETLGGVCAALHREHGVDLRLSTGVAGFDGDGRVGRVRLTDGGAVDADVVVVGVGVRPATEWLSGSGLALAPDGAVVCDETCAAAPGIVAAGDCAQWPNPLFGGERMRLEHWTNAAEQGVYAGTRLLAVDEPPQPFAPVPFVWSDQYDVKIQAVGRFTGDDEMVVSHGSLDEYRFTAIFGRAGRLTGALAFSMPRPLMQYRRMLAQGSSWADALATIEGAA